MWMLDTNIVSELAMKRSPIVAQRATECPGPLVISSITVAEALFGLAKKGWPERLSAAVYTTLRHLEAMPWEPSSARAYAELRTHLEHAGRPIGPLDTLIAAHALELDATLVTANVREFARVPGLRIENWLEQQ
jgi:tRNA(fMet)-specific endonuclease VapC